MVNCSCYTAYSHVDPPRLLPNCLLDGSCKFYALASRVPGEQLEAAPRTREVRRGVLAAARSLHRAGVVHGDLAARNILVDATDPVPVVSTTPLAVRVCLMLFLLVLDLMPEHELRGGETPCPLQVYLFLAS